MPIRKLPDLSPEQVVSLQDALLANADVLLQSALAILDLGHVALARSLAILGLEESGKAVAVHQRRVQMTVIPEGSPFRCDWLDQLWASHEKKLSEVHEFLVDEQYWFGVEPSDPAANAAVLGTIRAWARRHDRSKQRGFYVELSKTGSVMTPSQVADEQAVRDVVSHVHQIGWQIRLGEHIEGKGQDQQERDVEPASDELIQWMERILPKDHGTSELLASARTRTPGRPLRNAAYRFNPPGKDPNPFHTMGKLGYEAETREVLALAADLDQWTEPQTNTGAAVADKTCKVCGQQSVVLRRPSSEDEPLAGSADQRPAVRECTNPTCEPSLGENV